MNLNVLLQHMCFGHYATYTLWRTFLHLPICAFVLSSAP